MTLRNRLFPVEEVNKKRIKMDLKDLEDENITGLNVVMSSLIDACDSGLYDESRRAFDLIKTKFHRWKKSINEMPKSSVYSTAHENLDYITYLKFIPRKSASIINFLSFILMYELIEIRYFMSTKRELNDMDIQNVYLSGLDERLIFGLDKFDKISEWRQPTAEFFQKLKKVRWEDKNAEKFSNRLGRLKIDMTITSFGLPKYFYFSAMEKAFIELIAGCSAVNGNRDLISKEDIVIGYKTYLKLLKTNVTKYKARPNLRLEKKSDGNGYLVCEKCNEYYKLKSGESAEDFSDECECGSKLKYYDDIDWLFDEASPESPDRKTYHKKMI